MNTNHEPYVLFFENEYYCLSNFSSFRLIYKSVDYDTAEAAYQAAKFNLREIQEEIQTARSAHDAKKVARKHSADVRSNWDAVKIDVMEEILRAKMSQHDFVLKKLKKSGTRIIVENSPQDSFWGWGSDFKGNNQLGKLWMKIRDEKPWKKHDY